MINPGNLGWWQLKHFLFSPLITWGNDSIWRAYFSTGRFNHQLVMNFSRRVIRGSWAGQVGIFSLIFPMESKSVKSPMSDLFERHGQLVNKFGFCRDIFRHSAIYDWGVQFCVAMWEWWQASCSCLQEELINHYESLEPTIFSSKV